MKVFVITPYKSDQYFKEKRNLILNNLNAEKIDVIFASNENTEVNTDFSLSSLEACDFVIADLSFERPSCYFEVGFAQAKNKKVFLIALENTTIHQVKSKSKIRFYKNIEDYEKLIKDILKSNKT